MSDVRTQVRQLVADLLQVPLDSLSEASGPDTVAAWDSLQHLNLVLVLEDAFSIQFEPDEIGELTSIAAISALVAERRSST